MGGIAEGSNGEAESGEATARSCSTCESSYVKNEPET